MNRGGDYFSSGQLHTDLKGKAVRGGAYSAAAQAMMVLTSLVAIPVLSRLLEPADFGLVAMVTVFTGLAAMLVDAGLTMATVQREEITHQQVSNLFWVAASFGLLIAFLVCAASPFVAWFYGEPRLIPISIALSAATFFSGLTIQHQALLRRTMRLRQIAVVQITAYTLSYALAIAVAWLYRSYWALVALPVLMAVLRMAGVWIACPWRPTRPRRSAEVRTMVGFGANLTGFNFVNYFARSGDNMLIGWWWGDTALGFYERAYRLMMAPLRQINGPLAGIMIPALSRLQTRPESYRAAYFRAVTVLQVVSCPLMALAIVMAPSIVLVMFGPGYEAAAPILRWLALAGFIQPLTSSLGWLYVSQGRGRELMRWGLLGCPLIVLSFLLGLAGGPLGVARAYAVMICVVIAPLALWFAGSKGPVSRADLTRACGAAGFMAAPTFAASMMVVYTLPPASAIVELTSGALASASATIPLLLLTRYGRSVIAQFKDITREILRKPLESKASTPDSERSARAG